MFQDPHPAVFNDDLGMGARFAFNDAQSTAVLAGLIIDRNNGGKFINVEASRRLGESWLLELQGRFFMDISHSDPAYSFNRDDYMELFLTYNF